MPPEWEYLHAVSVELDETGLCYEVLDTMGTVRERLTWPLPEPVTDAWQEIAAGEPQLAPSFGDAPDVAGCLRRHRSLTRGSQTILCAWNDDAWLSPLWIGLIGPEQR
jgi:hypothetical protein